jgi:choline dehydrogenase-like flavoprotein
LPNSTDPPPSHRYPYSRGHVHITGPSITDPIDFNVGFFSDKGDIDLKKHVWAYKKQREIMRRTRMYRGEVAAGHPPFASGSGAACVEEGGGAVGHDVEGDIRYSAEDDAAIEAWLRENVGTTWHSLGTAKMAPVARLGVVDEALSVHDLQRLKLADLWVTILDFPPPLPPEYCVSGVKLFASSIVANNSIFCRSIVPENVGANTANTAMVIGEKAADMFIRELGLAHA